MNDSCFSCIIRIQDRCIMVSVEEEKKKTSKRIFMLRSHHNVLKMIHNSGPCIRDQIDNDESVPHFVLLFIFHILE